MAMEMRCPHPNCQQPFVKRDMFRRHYAIFHFRDLCNFYVCACGKKYFDETHYDDHVCERKVLEIRKEENHYLAALDNLVDQVWSRLRAEPTQPQEHPHVVCETITLDDSDTETKCVEMMAIEEPHPHEPEAVICKKCRLCMDFDHRLLNFTDDTKREAHALIHMSQTPAYEHLTENELRSLDAFQRTVKLCFVQGFYESTLNG